MIRKIKKISLNIIKINFLAMDSKVFWKIIAQIFNEKELHGEVDKKRWWKTEQAAEGNRSIL